jgi:hypothetical protein
MSSNFVLTSNTQKRGGGLPEHFRSGRRSASVSHALALATDRAESLGGALALPGHPENSEDHFAARPDLDLVHQVTVTEQRRHLAEVDRSVLVLHPDHHALLHGRQVAGPLLLLDGELVDGAVRTAGGRRRDLVPREHLAVRRRLTGLAHRRRPEDADGEQTGQNQLQTTNHDVISR